MMNCYPHIILYQSDLVVDFNLNLVGTAWYLDTPIYLSQGPDWNPHVTLSTRGRIYYWTWGSNWLFVHFGTHLFIYLLDLFFQKNNLWHSWDCSWLLEKMWEKPVSKRHGRSSVNSVLLTFPRYINVFLHDHVYETASYARSPSFLSDFSSKSL